VTVLPNITKTPSWLAAIPDPGLAELQACCKAAESVALIYTNALRSNTVSRALCDGIAVMANDILARVDVARRLPPPPLDVLFRTRAEVARKELPTSPPPDGLRTPARAARKPRQSPPDGLKTAAQAAAKLGCSIKTLNGHVASGALRYVIIGHGTKRPRRMFSVADLDAFIVNQTRKDVPCPSIATRAPRSGNTTSSGEVIAFSAQPRPRPGAKPKR
jgi:hypothetical protein